jgi:hypothetical protein
MRDDEPRPVWMRWKLRPECPGPGEKSRIFPKIPGFPQTFGGNPGFSQKFPKIVPKVQEDPDIPDELFSVQVTWWPHRCHRFRGIAHSLAAETPPAPQCTSQAPHRL